MKVSFSLFFVLFSLFSSAAELKELKVGDQTLYYYYIPAPESKGKTLVFLHGSVTAGKESAIPRQVPLDSLLEMNSAFIGDFNSAGYNCLVPIAWGKYNWLDPEGESYLQKLLEAEGLTEGVFLSGFSDGATGAYRYFYQEPEKYEGLLMFNAFPQLGWFSKNVDYKRAINKKVLFFSQDADKEMPYEFMLVEYRRQKMLNPESYFVLRPGKHEFRTYTGDDFKLALKILAAPMQVKANPKGFVWIYPCIDGLIMDNKLVESYSFRKMIGKKYNISLNEYMSQEESSKIFMEKLKQNLTISFLPMLVSESEFQKENFFTLEFRVQEGQQGEVMTTLMDNYLLLNPW